MSELRKILDLWREARENREDICLATVVDVEGSSYRKPGARMLLASGGRRTGTISGGCLEAEVQKKSWWLTETGPAVQKYSSFYDEDSEMPYGLGCGGTISVLLERGEAAERVLAELERGLASRTALASVSVIDTESPGTRLILAEDGQTLYQSRLLAQPPENSVELARQALRERRSLWVRGKTLIFAEYIAPPAGLFVIGAGDDAQPLVEFASSLGWHITVVDGRSHLATQERFPSAERVMTTRHFEQLALTDRDAAVILTHSYEQDRAALRTFLPMSPGYLGILGPRRRTEKLLAGIAPDLHLSLEECFARLHSPVGLDIGAKNPTSIALAIVAEIHGVLERRDSQKLHESAGQASVVCA
jgi:xanthine dehydrogenase accessory factor